MPIELPVLQDLRMSLPAPDVERCDGGGRAPGRPDPGQHRADAPRRARLRLRDGCRPRRRARTTSATTSRGSATPGSCAPSRFEADTRRVYYERDDEACRRVLAALGEVLR